MAASWLDREPGVAVALEQMRRVLEGGIKSAGVSLLLSVAAGAFAVVLVVAELCDFTRGGALQFDDARTTPSIEVHAVREPASCCRIIRDR